MASSTRRTKFPLRELCVFSMLGTLLLLSQAAMQLLPNIHLLGLLIASITLTYRVRALFPLYVYILLYGALYGFAFWWLPYLYIWLPLWLIFMAAGKLKLSAKIRAPLFALFCGFHGLAFGTLYAPAQALMFGLSLKATLAWIAAGLPFDLIHAAGNLAAGTLILPLSALLQKLEKTSGRL